MADRLVRPYRMGPWAAGSMIVFAFVVVPIVTALAALILSDAISAGGLSALPDEEERARATGALTMTGVLVGYLAIASVINAIRFVGLRRRVVAHYAQLRQIAERDPARRRDVPPVLNGDLALYREDRRRHVLRNAVDVLSFIFVLFGSHSTDSGATEVIKHPRSGQFGYKLFWGLLIIGGGTVALFLADSPTTDTRMAAGIYLALNLLWWVPSLWRSVALRRVDQAWRDGLLQVHAAMRIDPPKWLRTGKDAPRPTPR
ncbi:hypothetical protein GCM10027298_14170 [Epidermidibacterium keratini]